MPKKPNARFVRLRRQQLDRQLSEISSNCQNMQTPSGGWVKEIRQALGMTAGQLARRLGVKPPSLYKMELGEARGAVTLNTLRRAAAALGCNLYYVLIPQGASKESSSAPLEYLARQRALKVATRMVERLSVSMELEKQKVGRKVQSAQIEELADELLKVVDGKIWED